MPGAERQTQRALLQEQWASLDDLTERLGRRVRERPNRDAEDGPGHLPDPNVAQELILTRGRLASVEKERDRLQRRLEATRQKLQMLRTELRRERRRLDRQAGGAAPEAPGQAAAATPPSTPGAAAPTALPAAPHLEIVRPEPAELEVDFEGAPLPEAGPQIEPAALAGEASVPEEAAFRAAEAELDQTAAELTLAVAELDDIAEVLTAAQAELTAAVTPAATSAAPAPLVTAPDAAIAAPEPAAAPAEPVAAGAETAEAAPDHAVHWSARALFERISARWRDRGPRG